MIETKDKKIVKPKDKKIVKPKKNSNSNSTKVTNTTNLVCSKCGTDQKVSNFAMSMGFFAGATQTFCVKCGKKEQRNQAWGMVITIILFIIILVFFAAWLGKI